MAAGLSREATECWYSLTRCLENTVAMLKDVQGNISFRNLRESYIETGKVKPPSHCLVFSLIALMLVRIIPRRPRCKFAL